MVSPICTSRLTGAAGRSKPCWVATLTCAGRRDRDAWCCFFFLKRALASLDTCSSARCAARSRSHRARARRAAFGCAASQLRAADARLRRARAASACATRLLLRRARALLRRRDELRPLLRSCSALPLPRPRALRASQALAASAAILLPASRCAALRVAASAASTSRACRCGRLSSCCSARLLFEHAAIQVRLLAADLDVDHARTALRRGDLDLALRLALAA